MMNHKKVESHPSAKEELLDLFEIALVSALKPEKCCSPPALANGAFFWEKQ
ncbi:MAG: hypothetical protein WCS95_05455 [Lentisphaeria bacterium]|jgi:hypothetical protein